MQGKSSFLPVLMRRSIVYRHTVFLCAGMEHFDINNLAVSRRKGVELITCELRLEGVSGLTGHKYACKDYFLAIKKNTNKQDRNYLFRMTYVTSCFSGSVIVWRKNALQTSILGKLLQHLPLLYSFRWYQYSSINISLNVE